MDLPDFKISYHHSDSAAFKNGAAESPTLREDASGFEDKNEPVDVNLVDVKIESQQNLEKPIALSPEVKKAIADRLNYRYPVKADDDLPSKMSVTEIKNYRQSQLHEKGLDKNMPQRLAGPKFLEQKQTDFTATQRGSALHLLMEVVDLNRSGGADQ